MTSTARCLRLGLVVAGLAALGCRERPAEPVTQLLDAAQGAQVEGLPPFRLRWARDHVGTVGSQAARDAWQLVAVRLGSSKKASSVRQSLVALAGGRYRFHLRLPRQARLDFAIGAYGEAPPSSPGIGYSVRARAVDDGTTPVEWQERLRGNLLNAWHERSVDLSSLGGREVEIELANDGDPAFHGGWATPVVVPGSARDPRPDILLISLDTVRADHLGAWGYSRPTSPNLDRLADSGFRFAQTIAQSCWTRPSHRAILSGLAPVSRGGLTPHPIAQPLWQAGYETLAFTGGGQVDPAFGFGFGFERYDMADWLRDPQELADRLAERRGRPIFAFLHTYEPHDPYDDDRFAGPAISKLAAPGFSLGRMNRMGKKGITPAEKSYIEALYDGDIAFADAQLGKLFAALSASGVAEHAIIVVTSDHGEQFWEHNDWRHGSSLFDHDIHVPLLVVVPPAVRAQVEARTGHRLRASGVVADQVRSIDIYPTLLELAGVPLPGPVQGRSLVPWLEGDSLPPIDALSESITHRPYELKSLRTERVKLLRVYPHRGAEADPAADSLYDLRRDPGEVENLAAREPQGVELLGRRLAELTRGGDAALDEELPADADPELRRQLQALGYLGGGDGSTGDDGPP